MTSALAQMTNKFTSMTSDELQVISQHSTPVPTAKIKVFSWNVSGDAFIKNPALFKALINQAQANILLLDEVSGNTTLSQIRAALPISQNNDDDWQLSFGKSGGRQRAIIASRLPMQPLTEFSQIVPYPEPEKIRLRQRMAQAGELKYAESLDLGIPVNGAIVRSDNKRLLLVSVDLECCGSKPSSWEEDKRRVEVTAIRTLIQNIIKRTQVDGIIVAGDFNLVSTVMPLVIIAGPYQQPHAALLAAELKHINGQQTWTWDGRGTDYPSRVMDLVLYSPQSLELIAGYVFNPENLSLQQQNELGLAAKGFAKISEHLPLMSKFNWVISSSK